MRKIVLHAGSRPRTSRHGHGHAAQDQAFGHSLHSLRIPFHQAVRVIHAAADAVPDEAGHCRTVIFPVDQGGKPPFADTGILGQHVSHTGPQHRGRSHAENVNVIQDRGRKSAVQ